MQESEHGAGVFCIGPMLMMVTFLHIQMGLITLSCRLSVPPLNLSSFKDFKDSTKMFMDAWEVLTNVYCMYLHVVI